MMLYFTSSETGLQLARRTQNQNRQPRGRGNIEYLYLRDYPSPLLTRDGAFAGDSPYSCPISLAHPETSPESGLAWLTSLVIQGLNGSMTTSNRITLRAHFLLWRPGMMESATWPTIYFLNRAPHFFRYFATTYLWNQCWRLGGIVRSA